MPVAINTDVISRAYLASLKATHGSPLASVACICHDASAGLFWRRADNVLARRMMFGNAWGRFYSTIGRLLCGAVLLNISGIAEHRRHVSAVLSADWRNERTIKRLLIRAKADDDLISWCRLLMPETIGVAAD